MIKVQLADPEAVAGAHGRGAPTRRSWRARRSRAGRSTTRSRCPDRATVAARAQRHLPAAATSAPTRPRWRRCWRALGLASLEALIDATVPAAIRLRRPLRAAASRAASTSCSTTCASMAAQNQVFRSFIGMGYHDCITPPVIQRNILENPGWYTQYTPYQAEIAQGRLEALLNFQTMVADLTGLPIANASLLDEATAAAEAMAHVPRAGARAAAARVLRRRGLPSADDRGGADARAAARASRCAVGRADARRRRGAGPLRRAGAVPDDRRPRRRLRARWPSARTPRGALVVVAADLLALTLLRPPGEFGADIAVGSTPALRRAAGLRRPARRVPGHARRVQAPDARAA